MQCAYWNGWHSGCSVLTKCPVKQGLSVDYTEKVILVTGETTVSTSQISLSLPSPSLSLSFSVWLSIKETIPQELIFYQGIIYT